MIRLLRLGATVLLAYMFGFLWFAMAMPGPAGDEKTDAIVVLTGGEGRINRAFDMLAERRAPELLVSGVGKKVRPRELAAEYKVSAATMACCVTLDYKSVDTRSNAGEAAFWLAAHKMDSVRLVTSDWHMRRAAMELARVASPGTRIVEDAVVSHPSFETLVLEYNKLIARAVGASWVG